MNLHTILLAALAVTTTALFLYSIPAGKQLESDLAKDFLSFNTRFGKTYVSLEERAFRFQIYARNKQLIARQNAKNLPYQLGETPFTDMTFEEFSSRHLFAAHIAHRPNSHASSRVLIKDGDKDWRKDGKVNPPGDSNIQDEAWASSGISSIESAIAIKTGQLVSLSTDEVIACATSGTRQNIGGGFLSTTFDYVQKNNVNLKTDYTAGPFECKPNFSKPRYGIQNSQAVSPPDVNGLIDALNSVPVSVVFEVREDFEHYVSGVYTNDDNTCGQQLNHTLAAVGYSVYAGSGFFILKNSWGPDWGEEGYVRVAIGTQSGTCGIASEFDLYAQV